MLLCGIDYGSKLAGTTVICMLEWGSAKCHFYNSLKNQDADKFILDTLSMTKPRLVCIDAPLSLPGVYTQLAAYNDYFFRQADRQLQAMSPMFLGGLTARAIKIKADLAFLSIPVYETYPAAQAKHIELGSKGYKKNMQQIPFIVSEICNQYPQLNSMDYPITSWHQVDAMLALIGAIRLYENKQIQYGDEEEGVIIV